MSIPGQIGLRARLTLAAMLVIGIQMLFSMVTDIHSARQEVRRQQVELGAWVASGLSEALTNSLLVNDFATVQSTVERLFSDRRFLQLSVFDGQQRTIVDLRAKADARPDVPDWFSDFLQINELPSRRTINVGGVEYGFIVVLISPAATIERAWLEMVKAVAMAAVAIVVLWLSLGFLLRLGLRPLAELTQTVQRIGQGDFSVRAGDRGVPEFGKFVAVINLMTQRLAELLERTREQAASEIQARRLKAFHAITTTAGESREKLDALLDMGMQHFDMEAAALVLAASNAPDASVATVCRRGQQVAGSGDLPCESLCRTVIAQRTPLVVDASTQPSDANGDREIAAFLAAPVSVAGQASGVVCFWRQTPRSTPVPSVDIEFVNLIGQWIGLAVTQEQSERLLWEEKERLQVTIASIGDAVVATDPAGLITFLNPIAEKLLAVPLTEASGRGLLDLCDLVDEVTRLPIPNPIEDCLARKCRVELAARGLLVRPDGSECPIEDSAAPIFDYQGEIVGAVMVFRDVTNARVVAHHLEFMASHDPLTNLPNRRAFEAALVRVLTGAKLGSNQTHGLCFIDLDHFKQVNDTCGHAAGDELLRQLASLFNANLRGTDILARLGGDEFGLILAHISPERALETAERICRAVRDFEFRWGEHVFRVGASIGLATVDAQAPDAGELIRRADAACYRAKRGGRGQVCWGEPAADQAVRAD